MPISEKTQGLLDQALKAIQQDAQHQLLPDTLKTIYKAFDDLGAETAKQAHNVLVVVMAKFAFLYIQPMLQGHGYLADPEDDNPVLPHNWLNLMEKTVHDKLKTDDQAFQKVVYATGGDWEIIFSEKLKVQLAFNVIEYAAKVIDQGWPAGRSGINIRTKEKIVIRFDADETAAEMYALVHDEVTEAMPVAEIRRTDPARYLTFWTWWLSEAVPYAWDYAEQHSTAPIAIAFPVQ